MQFINTLSDLVAQAESSCNPYCLRFEPGWVPNPAVVETISKLNRCNLSTARIIAATSYGLYQIMGQNLYELGLLLPIGHFFGERWTQTKYFQKFITSRKIDITLEKFIQDKEAALNFCHHYNGNAEAYYTYLWSILKRAGEV